MWTSIGVEVDDEPLALEGAKFEASFPSLSLARLSAVDWPSWKSERHERFPEVSSVETFYVPITLISTPVWILSSRVQLSESTSARGRSLELLR